MKRYIPIDPLGMFGRIRERFPLVLVRRSTGEPVFGNRYVDDPYGRYKK